MVGDEPDGGGALPVAQVFLSEGAEGRATGHYQGAGPAPACE